MWNHRDLETCSINCEETVHIHPRIGFAALQPRCQALSQVRGQNKVADMVVAIVIGEYCSDDSSS